MFFTTKKKAFSYTLRSVLKSVSNLNLSGSFYYNCDVLLFDIVDKFIPCTYFQWTGEDGQGFQIQYSTLDA